MSDAGDRPPIVEIEAARAEGDGGPTVSLTLHAGELVVIEAADLGRAEAFADLCAGLAQPAEGRVRFLGRTWTELRPEQADALRGRIGRVFAVGGWIPHLSAATNVLLPQLYHSNVPEAVLRERAAALAQAFGLPGLPLGLAADQPLADLARAACVRAFLGDPPLILLESPLHDGLFPDLGPPLLDALAGARARGAACLWLTRSSSTSGERHVLPGTRPMRLSHCGLLPAELRPG